MMENKKYFKNISFLKFLFAIFILVLHFTKQGIGKWIGLENDLTNITTSFISARYAVEFFFIMSGFFFIITFKPLKSPMYSII